jgi:hypothetical protein
MKIITKRSIAKAIGYDIYGPVARALYYLCICSKILSYQILS